MAVERPQRHQQSGSPYRVRVDLTVPPGHELVAVSEPAEGDLHDTLDTVVLRTFKAVRRSLRRRAALQRGAVKTHHEPRALVARLDTEAGSGFLRTPGRRSG